METLYIGHDLTTAQREVIFSEKDFVALVYEHLGRDCEEYLKSIIESRDEALRDYHNCAEDLMSVTERLDEALSGLCDDQ